MTNLINKITLAGLIFLGAETAKTKAQYYNNRKWTIVTAQEFERLKIPKDSIQTIDWTKSEKDLRYTDNSKRGKKFIDTDGAVYYWVNLRRDTKFSGFDRGRQGLVQKPGYQTKEEIKGEKLSEAQELEAIVEDPIIKNLIKDFNSSFQVKWQYCVLGEDIMDTEAGYLRKKGKEIFMNLLKDTANRYSRGTILKDKKTLKEVLVIERDNIHLDDNLESLLNHISMGSEIKRAIKFVLSAKNRALRREDKELLKTLEEKKDFIIPYFTDSIPNAIKNLPKYNPPIIYKNEFKQTAGKPVEYKGVKFDSVKSTSVEMNEQKLDEILRED